MKKWHINDKLEPAICTATVGKCPYGEHYETQAEAWKIAQGKKKEQQEALEKEYIENQKKTPPEKVRKVKDDNKTTQERVEEIGQWIEDAVNSFSEDESELNDFLRFCGKLDQYSATNKMLIWLQRPGSVHVGSFNYWKEQGQQIKKGEAGAWIFVPVTATYFEDENGLSKPLFKATKEEKDKVKKGLLKTKSYQRFKAGNVWDISQTSVPTENYPSYLGFGKDSREHKDVAEKLTHFVSKNICKVELGTRGGAALYGSYSPSDHKISISELLKDDAHLSTLTHEIGHALLHNTTARKERGERKYTSQEEEIQADAFSIMFSHRMGHEVERKRIRHLSNQIKEYEEQLEREEVATKRTGDPKQGASNTQVKKQQRIMNLLSEVDKAFSTHMSPFFKELSE